MQYLVREWGALAVGHTVVFYDLRGRGRSDPAPDSLLSASADADDLEALRRDFTLAASVWPPIHSGATVAALYARAIRSTSPGCCSSVPASPPLLLLLGCHRSQRFPPRRPPDPGDSGAREHPRSGAFLPRTGASGSRRWRSPTPSVVRRLAPGVCDAPAERLLAVDRLNDRYFKDAYRLQLEDSLATIQIPALVMQGAADDATLSSSRAWATWLPQGRELLMPALDQRPLPWIGAEREFFHAAGRFSRWWLAGTLPFRPAQPAESVTNLRHWSGRQTVTLP